MHCLQPTAGLIAVVALVLVGAIAPAGAVMIDFSDLPLGIVPNGTLVVSVPLPDGDAVDVTFAAPGLQLITLPTPFPAARVLISGNDPGGAAGGLPITMMFEDGFTADEVTVTNFVNGTYTSEIDGIRATALTPGGDALGDAAGMDTLLTVTAPGIGRVVYDDLLGPIPGRPGETFSGGFAIGDISFDVGLPTPVSAPGALGLLGIAAAVAWGRAVLRPSTRRVAGDQRWPRPRSWSPPTREIIRGS